MAFNFFNFFLFCLETIWPSRPFKPSQMRQKIYVVPVKDIYHVNLTFPMEDLLDYYSAAPHAYLAQIIGKDIFFLLNYPEFKKMEDFKTPT